jgi:hypothetical protein
MERCHNNLPDLTMHLSEGRLDVPPASRSFFVAEKRSGQAANFVLPLQKQSIDPRANLGEVMLSRRFQR